MLWKDIFYGPVVSRRLGYSLGVNLLPQKRKICNFNCVYCECGLNEKDSAKVTLPSLSDFETGIIETLKNLKNKNQLIDHITFSGNGEPTLHPNFDKIIDITIKYRNEFFPNSKIAVLTNSSRIHISRIYNALLKIDIPICKLDAGSNEQFLLIDAPEINVSIEEITEKLSKFSNQLIIQTIFLKGIINDQYIDNTTSDELNLYINRLKKIRPKMVMIYSLDRTPPYPTLQHISNKELENIAQLIRSHGFHVEYYS